MRKSAASRQRGKRLTASDRKPGKVPWSKVRQAAEAGNSGEDIAVAFHLKPVLQGEVAEEFRRTVAEGNARHRVTLRTKLRRRAFGSRGTNASPTVLTALARADLAGFADGPATPEEHPALGDVKARVEVLVVQLRRKYIRERGHVDIGGALVPREELIRAFGESSVLRAFPPGVAQ